MSQKYSVTIKNKSANTFDFCIFQTGKDADASNSVVWLCKRCHPDTCVNFTWDTEYCFFWADKGKMEQRKDAKYFTWGTNHADPQDSAENMIGFTYTDGAYEFTGTQQKGTQGMLGISADGTIPVGEAMIGIGMSDNCICCTQASPNMTQMFELPVEYRAAFGNMSQGDPLDSVVLQQSVLLSFPTNVFDLIVTLKEDNTWSQPE